MNISILQDSIRLPELILPINREGAISVRLIDEPTRLALVAEARSLAYEYKPEYLASGVREQLSACESVPTDGPCAQLCSLLESTIEQQARQISPYPFTQPFELDEMVIQRYATGSAGITPHRDFSDRVNLVCVLILEGQGRFGLCDDRAGSHPWLIRGEPGDLIIMRAPGFLGSDYRPMHFLDSIHAERFALGMRCTKK